MLCISRRHKCSNLIRPVLPRLPEVYMASFVFFVSAMVLFVPGIAHSRDYPSRPIRLIVPFASGSTPDVSSRRIANELSRQMGQQVLVDNRVGATGIIGTELIARAAPDG